MPKRISDVPVEKTVPGAPPRPIKPKAIELYRIYKQIAEELEKINPEYYIADRDLREAKDEYKRGGLRRAGRKSLEERIEKLRGDWKKASAKRKIAIAPAGFQTVTDFERAYSETRKVCIDYRKAVDEWERKYLLDSDKASSIGAKLAVERKIQTMQKWEETKKEKQQNRKRGMEL